MPAPFTSSRLVGLCAVVYEDHGCVRMIPGPLPGDSAVYGNGGHIAGLPSGGGETPNVRKAQAAIQSVHMTAVLLLICCCGKGQPDHSPLTAAGLGQTVGFSKKMQVAQKREKNTALHQNDSHVGFSGTKPQEQSAERKDQCQEICSGSEPSAPSLQLGFGIWLRKCVPASGGMAKAYHENKISP